MRQTLSRSVVAATAATSILSLCGGTAQADTYASGGASDSPGLLSGNSIQAPVDAPVNACGNSVDAVGALNPAFGNSCGGGSGSKGSHHGHAHVPAQHTPSAAHGDRGGHGGSGYGDAGHGDSGHGGSGYGDSGYGDSGHGGRGHGRGGHDGSFAHGPASDSPGIGSGNSVEVPVHAPVNLCGDTVDIIGVGNGAFGNSCGEQGGYGDDSPGGYGDTPGGYGDDTPPTRTPPGHPHHPPTTRNIPPGETPHGETPPGTPPSHGAPPAHPRGSSVARHRATPPALAETGAGSNLTGATAAAALIAGGAVLYRRGRVASQR